MFMTATVTPNVDFKTYVVYDVIDCTGVRVFAHTCRFTDALTLKDVIANPDFDKTATYTVRILSKHVNRHEASNAFGKIMSIEGMPHCNKTMKWGRYGAVKCIQTGQVYKNAATCARMLGIPQSRLSTHLAGQAGHRSINKMTFCYANADDLKIKDMIL